MKIMYIFVYNLKLNNMETNNNFYVYKHTSPSGKCYIGITCQEPEYRWGNNGYKYTERKSDGQLKHPKFANAILKYGWNNFSHEILHENLSKEEACSLEQKYISMYKEGGKSYNISDGGEGNRGYKFTDEQRKRMSEAQKGKKQSLETIAKRVAKNTGKKRSNKQKEKISKKVLQYTKDLQFIAKYFGAREAERQTGINCSHIVDCCNKKANRKSARGYIWTYEGQSPSQFIKENYNRKVIGQYDLEGNLIKKWGSMKEIIESCNISRYMLQKYCKNGIPDKNDFIWKEF